MRVTSYIVILVVTVGLAVSGWWVYGKYFREAPPVFSEFRVERGDIAETVRVRGEVAASKEYEMGFELAGTAEAVYVRDGEIVAAIQPLLKLDTRDLEIEANRLGAVLAQKEINLKKLLAGAAKEDIQVLKTKVTNAETARNDARNNLVDKLQDGYIRTDDAIKNKADQFFSDPHTTLPKLNFQATDAQLKLDAETQRSQAEVIVAEWKTSLAALTAAGDLNVYTQKAYVNMRQIASFFDTLTSVLNKAIVGSSLTQTILNTYQSDVATARLNVNTAINSLTLAEEKLKTAESALSLARDELAAKEAPPRSEDVSIAEAQVEETKNQFLLARDKIRKSTLYAPVAGRVKKIYLEKGEIFKVGDVALSLAGIGDKIQADVSELDIGKIHPAQPATISLDAFPGKQFNGQAASVEPQEIVKEGDKYYRLNVDFDGNGSEIRSGMSADVAVLVDTRKDVLKIPEVVIYQKNGETLVAVRENGINREAGIKTGISDGEFIEVLDGLNEGQTVVVFTD